MDVTILDLGSHTVKAGVPYNFPADANPSVVRSILVSSLHRSFWGLKIPLLMTVQGTCRNLKLLSLQITPSRIVSSAEKAEDVLNGNLTSQSDGIPVIERGTISHWDGLEALLQDVIHNQAST